MQALHQSKYYEIYFDKEKSLITHKALPTTSEMSLEEFKQEMFRFVELCEQLLPTRDLVNLMNMNYIITPEVQEWVNSEIFPRFENIIQQIALLLPSGIFESVALEQTMEEEGAQKFTQKYFDNEDQALKWLMSN